MNQSSEQVQASQRVRHDKGEPVKRKKLVAVFAVTALLGTLALASVDAAGAKVVSDARGVTSDSITVAGICDPNFSTSAVGAQARFDAENAKGGTNGRKYDFKGCNNDNDDPNQDLTIGKRLVQQDGVFAIVPTMTPTLASAPFFAQQKVPFIGWGISTGFCNNPYALAFTGCIVPPPNIKTTGTTWGELMDGAFKKAGDPKGAKGKTAAVISEDNDAGKTGTPVIVAQAKYVKMKVVYGKASIPAPPAVVGDYSPYVTAIMTSNKGQPPDVVFVVTSFANVLGLSNALLQAGYKGQLTNAVAYDPALTKAASGQSVFAQFDVPEDTGNPNMVKIVDNIEKVSSAPIGQGTLGGYFAADAFIAAVKKAGKNLTPESFAKVLTKFTYKIKGVIGPTKYPQSRTLGAPCGVLVTSNGTAYEITVPYACYQDINYETLKPVKY
jgi:branched-chain amino acid transport system substrate-binding protein